MVSAINYIVRKQTKTKRRRLRETPPRSKIERPFDHDDDKDPKISKSKSTTRKAKTTTKFATDRTRHNGGIHHMDCWDAMDDHI